MSLGVNPQASPIPISEHAAFLVSVLPLARQTQIVDVGANPANRPAYADLVDAGVAQVHGFEPLEAAFAKLQKTKGPFETYHPHAVGTGGKATFYACRNGSFSSIFRPDPAQVEALGQWEKSMTVAQEVTCETVTLDQIAELPKPDMLKMDTQGAELSILEGGQEALSDAVVVMPEVRFFRLYQGEPMLGLVDQKLRDMGFMLHKILPGAVVRLRSSRISALRRSMTRNQMIDADAIYIRDIADPDAMTSEQIAHLALLADAVFVSVDLVLRCLDILVERGALADAALDDYIDRLPRKFRVSAEPVGV